MKKLFVIALAIAMTAAFVMPAMATQSRVVGLGGYGRYLEDDYNIFEWPATLPSYSNIVWIELSTEDWYYYGDPCDDDFECDEIVPMIGASYALGEDGAYGTLAMFFHEYSPPLNPFNWAPWSNDNIFGYGLSNKWTVLWGYGMEGLSFGFLFSRADMSYKYEDGISEESSESYTTISAGVRFDVGDNAYADINFDLSMASYTSPYTYSGSSGYGEVTDDGGMMYGFKARMFYEWNETITWVPYFSYSAFDFSLKADSADYNDNYFGDKAMMLDFGIGANITVNEDNLLLFAIEPFSYTKREPSEPPEGEEGSVSYTVMPRFILGLETDVKDWLTFRFGGCKELYKEKWEYTGEGDEDITETWTWSEFCYYMGLGFHVGDWDIDCTLNNSLPFHLGYWLTGYGQYDGEEESAVYIVSAKYHF